MIPPNKLLAIVTASLLMGSTASAQEIITISELRRIEGMIIAKDCRALYSYVIANPKFTAGSDALSSELRGFVRDTRRGNLDCFGPRKRSTTPKRVAGASGFVPATTIY